MEMHHYSWVLVVSELPVIARLHQASESTLQQLFHDTSNTVFIENDGVAPEWGCNLFLSNFIVFNMNNFASILTRVVAVLTLTLV